MMAAYIELAFRRRMGRNAELLTVIQAGSQGDKRGVQKLMRALQKEAQ